ncbi:hypothetical protein [Pseudaminobacter sp. NGMCC 1.201702]|uniref:hypothetical protein n=1 Tax=Pseudaminobacter sp. NGMCC 1.201702 TaxID=3391825 RepID=UPI0039EF929C
MVPFELPRYTSFKRLASGKIAFYWTCPSAYRKDGCPFLSAPLGINLSQSEVADAAKIWNDRLDDWRRSRHASPDVKHTRYGTIDWLVDAYLKHDSFRERVSEYSRPDYRRVFDRVCDLEIKSDRGSEFRVGDVKINQIGVSTAEKVYHAFCDQGAARTSEKVVTYCKAMWKRMRPHYPDLFRSDTPNPWEGVTVRRREKATKGHADRDATYRFARGALANDAPELAAAAVLAFEWLLRPSNIGAGWAAWTGYRGDAHPDKIVIRHRKNGEVAMHPLEYVDDEGNVVRLYSDAEAILSQVPQRGISIVAKQDGTLYGDGTLLSQRVREIADKIGLPSFTLDAARHGGMTELEEAGLTEGEGRVLSKHRTSTAYRGYAKETELRVLSATKKRFGHSEKAEKVNKNNGRKVGKST